MLVSGLGPHRVVGEFVAIPGRAASDEIHDGRRNELNVGVALFLYATLGDQIGQLREDIRRFAKRKRPDRRRPRSEPDARR